jgi:hypothetical protein
MGYGYAETFLIVFLTHPGVIIPTTGAAASKALSYMPSEASGVVPEELTSKLKEGLIPPFISGLWQVLWAWILSLPGEKGPAFGWTMYSLYLIFLLLYIYIPARMRLTAGI